MTKSRQLAYLALAANAIIWGAAFPIIKPAFDFITPTQYLYFRFLLAGIVSLPIFLIYYFKVHPKTSYLLKVLLIELLGTAPPLLILYEGLARTSALEASLIGSTGPIFIVIGSILYLHERESKREWQGMIISLLGSVILVAEPLINGHTFIGRSLSGNLYIVGYNLIYTIYVIIAKKVYKKKPPIYIGSLTYLLTATIYAIMLKFTGTFPSFSSMYNPSVYIPVIYMAIPGGIIAFALYLYAQSKIEVSEANLFTYLNGVIAIPASFILLGERPSFLTIIAILVIAYGVIRAETRSSH